ncbi:Hsp70 [Pistachio ampelovirus A]|uniref:Hsp70 n=1 Tax=Pistachio ampelovirus A TaxID=2093224 RepID=A0A499PYY5_9CLOS|nr:Hsp70 [Pistachio ampelovirus A]AVN99310.1 Hsp70 [Pistachio ampelovirus A]
MECGVDFGTTYSTVAFSGEGISGCVPIAGSVFVPTVVFIEQGAKGYYIGNVAISMSKRKTGRLYINLKRWVGATKSNLNEFRRKLRNEYTVEALGDYDVRIGGLGSGEDVTIGVTTLIYLFIRALIIETERFTGRVVAGLVCSVPADYNSLKRNYLSIATNSLGRTVRALVNEPTAAAIYNLARSETKHDVIGVFDFGGGTFDISIIVRRNNIFVVVYSIGDNHLGGRDVDRSIAERIASKLGSVAPESITVAVQGIKEELSKDKNLEDHVVEVDASARTFKFSYSELEEIASPYVDRAAQLFEKALSELGGPSCVVILTGGSSALPGIEKRLRLTREVKDIIFNQQDFRVSVALGAKVYCDILSGKSELRLIDTLTHALCDELGGYIPKVIFQKGSIVPNSTSVSYTISGSEMQYGLFEGEHIRTWLSELTYKGTDYRPNTAQSEDVVRYEITVDGRINLSVNGRRITNVMTPVPPMERYMEFDYLDELAESLPRFLKLYTAILSELSGLQFTTEEVEAYYGDSAKNLILHKL